MELQDVTRVCKVCGKEMDLENFHKTAWGYTHVCKECVKANRQKNKDAKAMLEDAERRIEEAKQATLETIPARDLMAELHRRGFDGVLEYDYREKRKIDISKIR